MNKIKLTTSILSLLALLAFSGCSTNASRDFALRSDDWQTWCKLNSKDALAGKALAMNNVGTCYAEGLGGFPKDPKMAREWYSVAAKRGNETARINLALEGQQSTPAKVNPEVSERMYGQLNVQRLQEMLPRQAK